MQFSLATIVIFASAVLAAPSPAFLNKLKRSSTGEAVADRYIVKLKDDASVSAAIQSLNDLVFALDDTESFREVTYSDWNVLNGYAAKLGGAALQHVLEDPNVEYVEEDGIFNINFNPEGLDVDELLAKREPNFEEIDARAPNGGGTNFYGIDTGIRITHNSFGGRASHLATFGGYPNTDGNGHGTHTAGSAAGSGFGPANAASIFAVKVLSDSGSGSFSDVISGINAATNHAVSSGRPSVANLSLGGGASTSVDSAVSNGVSRGVHYTIAAGNSNVNAANTSPARVASAITVGAIDSSRRKASFSNFGAVLDCWFLGVSVTSAWSTSNTATNTISGTSMAAPGVAGLVLVHLGNNGSRTPAAVISSLTAAAVSDVSGAPSGTTTRRCVAF